MDRSHRTVVVVAALDPSSTADNRPFALNARAFKFQQMNEDDLSFFYNKKSPIFLAEIVTLVTTILVRSYPVDSLQLQRFYIIVIVGCIAEILMKTVGLFIWKKLCSDRPTFEAAIIVAFLLYHIGLLCYAIVLYNNEEFRARYGANEPHFYYLKSYVWGYGIILFGSIAIFIVMAVIGACFTGKLFKKRKSQFEE